MEITINILIFLFGGYWVQQGIFEYKFWLKGVPGSGFIPVLFGALLMALSGYLFFQSLRKKGQKTAIETTKEAVADAKSERSEEKYPTWVRPLVPAVYTLLAIGLMVVVGVIPAMVLTAFVWLFYISKVKLSKSVLITVVITLLVYFVFVLWLRIPFPKGVFGI